jgi:hypothetical protein
MVLLTLPYWLLVQPLASAGESVTGVMSLSVVDALDCPATVLRDTAWTFAVQPAPYGITSLSRATVAVPTVFGTYAVSGVASSSWVDLSVKGAAHWRVTNSYHLGVAGTVRRMQAEGFASHWTGTVSLHATSDIDSVWTIGVGVDDLLFDAVGRTLRLGVAHTDVVTMSIDLNLAPTLPSFLSVGLLAEPFPDLTMRLTIRTSPLTTSLAARCSLLPSVPFIVQFDHVQHVGLRTTLIVELP